MKRHLLSISIFLLFSLTSFAQSAAIKGTIYSETGVPLTGITIALEGTQQATATDNEGVFYFGNISSGSYIAIASGVGYTAKSQAITIDGGKTVTINFQLNIKESLLQEVTVKANRRNIASSTSTLTRTNTALRDLPQHVQVVDRGTIQEQQLFTVDQAIKNVAGVNLSTSSGGYNIRGFTTYAGSFLTNGIKGSPYPEGITPLLGNIERVEVIHGPSAILFGEGALGGNINLVTKQPKKQTTANLSLSGGSFNLYRAMGDVTGSINKSKSLFFLAGAAYQNGGRFTKNFDNKNLQVYGSLKWDEGNKTTVQLNANFTRDRSSSNWMTEVPVAEGLPVFSLPDDFNYLGSDAKFKSNSYQVQAIVNHRFNAAWQANLLVGLTQTRADRKLYGLTWDYNPITTALGRSYSEQKINSPTRTINPYINGEFTIGKIKNKIATGLDITFTRSIYPNGYKFFRADSLYINAPVYAPAKIGAPLSYSSRTERFTYNTLGAYFQDQLELSSKFKALLGIRYTNYFMRFYSDDEAMQPIYDEKPEVTQAFTPRAGLIYQPTSQTSFYFDYNRGFIPQYSNERIFGGPFDPETANQFELGFKGSFIKNRLQANVAVYHTTKANVLVFYTDSLLPRGYGFKPLEQVRSKGVEVGVTGNIATGLFVIANYSYNETKIAKSNDPDQIGATFYNSPNAIANGWLSYAFSNTAFKGVSLGFGLSHVGDRTTYFGGIPAYTTADAMIGYAYKSYRLQLNGNNLFNKRYAQSGGYADYTPGAPRNLLVTFSYALK